MPRSGSKSVTNPILKVVHRNEQDRTRREQVVRHQRMPATTWPHRHAKHALIDGAKQVQSLWNLNRDQVDSELLVELRSRLRTMYHLAGTPTDRQIHRAIRFLDDALSYVETEEDHTRIDTRIALVIRAVARHARQP